MCGHKLWQIKKPCVQQYSGLQGSTTHVMNVTSFSFATSHLDLVSVKISPSQHFQVVTSPYWHLRSSKEAYFTRLSPLVEIRLAQQLEAAARLARITQTRVNGTLMFTDIGKMPFTAHCAVCDGMLAATCTASSRTENLCD